MFVQQIVMRAERFDENHRSKNEILSLILHTYRSVISWSSNWTEEDIRSAEYRLLSRMNNDDDLDRPVTALQCLEYNINQENYFPEANTVHNGFDEDIERIERNIRDLSVRIKRKIIHIMSFRQWQLKENFVPIAGVFNKYNTGNQPIPHISCRNMLKLIRWVRYFDRTVIPQTIEPRLICSVEDLVTIPRPTVELLQESQKIKSQACYVCRSTNFTIIEEGINFCQNCLFRKEIFLYGETLHCHLCDVFLLPSNFERWENLNWCQACLWKHCFETGLVKYEYTSC